jgi:sulfur carrier protein
VLITVNGERREVRDGDTVASVLELVTGMPDVRGVAVALDGEVVPRAAWPRTELSEGCRVEVVAAVQGG